MPRIDCEKESARLQASFDELIARLPAAIASASAGLLSRLKIRENAGARWVDQFSFDTLLYPILQAEAFHQCTLADARRANLAHLCLLIHSFAEDRQLDGQAKLEPAQILFSKHLLLEALSILRRLAGADPWFEKQIQDWMKKYSRAQLNTDSNIQTVVGRASMGILATLALARSSKCETRILGQVQRAYEHHVIGLQWLDDICDWPDDLRAGRANLLLGRLKHFGVSIEPTASLKKSIHRISHELIRQGVFAAALAEARNEIRRAKRIQKKLGCIQIAALLEHRLTGVDAIERKWVDAIASDLLQSIAPSGPAVGRREKPSPSKPKKPKAS